MLMSVFYCALPNRPGFTSKQKPFLILFNITFTVIPFQSVSYEGVYTNC